MHSTTSPFLARSHHCDRPVIVFDGAMGTNLQVQSLTAVDFGELEVFYFPTSP